MLGRIVATKREEVAALAPRRAELRARAEAAPAPRPFEAALRAGACVGLIAEIKRRSPSAGSIRPELSVAEVARAYAAAGAAALSVLTDRDYFDGSLEDLAVARAAVGLPALRKDFLVDEVQVWEARAAGADAVLLIVRILDDARLRALHALARELGLGVLVEVHDRAELDRALAAGATVVGINNRDLDTFRTDLGVTLSLAGSVPPGGVLVAESGIRGPEDVDRLAGAGVDAVLVGESLMRSAELEAAARALAGRPRGEPRRGVPEATASWK
ncbi:MAG: indole-3-glycerol phosphate synthase TrpC [Gemmatimonadetes bacterium]|nr:indole-3-glycerol phosphate synthase TrpC [Gemmatimonadota bacterium]